MNAELYDSLSEREKDVLRLLAGGHEAKSVAEALGLSVHTVNEYLRTARRKLDAPNSRTAARQLAAFEDEQSKKFGTPENLGDEKSGEAGAALIRQTSSSKGGRKVRTVLWIGGFVAMIVVIASVLALATGMVSVNTPAQPAVAEDTNTVPAAATQAAEAWLKLVDQGEWAASHEAMSESVKSQLTAGDWQNTVAPVRDGLGAFTTRTADEAIRASVLPGLPDGDYGMLQFKTNFANHPEAVETVVMMREGENWKVIGYFVR